MNGAVLFDLDGTLVDADHLHYESWRQIVAAHGVELTLERYRNQIMGFANPIILAALVPSLTAEAGNRLVDDKEVLFRSLATELEPATGLVEFLDFLDALPARYGVVTNAPRLNAEQELSGIGLRQRFDLLVIGDELDHAKPHPMPYLTGIEGLGALAEKSLAFEDSLSGIQSALAAGLAVVGLTTGLSATRLVEEGAHLAIGDFSDPRLRPFVLDRFGRS